jgi:hypothetical protein
MKKQLGLVAIALSAVGLLGSAEPLSTERKVHGVITAIEPNTLTINSEKAAVTGKLDPVRTKVTINGKPGKVSDLKLTEHAKGELCLDDVWLVIDEH